MKTGVFLNKELNTLWIKNTNGDIRTFKLEEIIEIDERDKEDPNIKIIDSFSITNKRDMTDILLLIKKYDDEHPSKWSRTINSMINEWRMHNICYEKDFYICNSKDVDLNNSDEDVFKGFNVYKLLLKKKELDK